MPKRADLKKILLLGPGPVIIGQTGEYDYACTQVCRNLRAEGLEVIVLDSNPVSLVTELDISDSIYIEPLTLGSIEKVIAKERPEGIIAIFGGQSALNLGYQADKEGILERYQVKLVGIDREIIEQTEDRVKFRQLIEELQLKLPAGTVINQVKEAEEVASRIGFPVVIRSSYALEGAGVRVAYNVDELEDFVEIGLNASPIRQVLVEEYLTGWKEFEFEVIQDQTGKCLIVSTLESMEPMGIHTGDSAVVIPSQSLSAVDYAKLTEICKKVSQKLKLTGGLNIQFAQNPSDGEIRIIEVNPRFTKSTALAAKASGFQIPATVTKIILDITFDEMIQENGQVDMVLPLAIDYVAVKLPRFSFDKFPEADQTLDAMMKSTGEVLAFGANFKEAFQKAIRSLQSNRYGFGADGRDIDEAKLTIKEVKEKIINPNPQRWFYLRYAFKLGLSLSDIANLSKLPSWFLTELQELLAFEKKITTYALYNLTPDVFIQAKKWGFSDAQIAYLLRSTEDEVRRTREKMGVRAQFRAIKYSGMNPDNGNHYYFSTYEPQNQSIVSQNPKILITGAGPNRIGIGNDFDYCAAHAVRTTCDMGYETVMVNCNPCSITTDPALQVKLYFEPLTKEDLLNIIHVEKIQAAIFQFSGKNAVNFSSAVQEAGVKVLGTPLDYFERSSNLNQLKEVVKKLGLVLPGSGTVTEPKGALETAGQIGYPIMIRSANDLGKMVEIIYSPDELQEYLEKSKGMLPNNPLLLEKFLDDAIGVIVTCIADTKDLVVSGIFEQIEEAAIHPGDCAGAMPPYSIGAEIISRIKNNTRLLAQELHIQGLFSIQYAIKHDSVYLLDVNSQATLLVPFIQKATGVDWVAAATKVMLGVSVAEQGLREIPLQHSVVKEAVFSFEHFSGVDTLLGPEMRSTGTVMGMAPRFGMAFMKAQLAAGANIPTSGTIFMSIRDEDKRAFTSITRQLIEFGFKIVAVEETAAVLNRNNLPCEVVYKVGEGRPNIVDRIKNGEIHWIISTSSGRKTRLEEVLIRTVAAQRNIPIITTVSGTQAAIIGLEEYLKNQIEVKPVQEYLTWQ